LTPGWPWPQVLGAALAAGCLALLASPQRLDNAIADVLLAQQKHSAAGPVLLVEITPADIARTQDKSAERGEIARALLYAGAGGARRIYLDVGFTTMRRPADNAALAAAMVAIGRDRLDAANKQFDRLEAEALDFHTRVRDAYLAMAEAEPQRFLVVDATLDRDAIRDAIVARLGELS
jgi:hypothetical protein